MFCGRNSVNKIFQAWKKMHYNKKTDRINKLAAQAMCDKNRAKKFIAAWKEYHNEKEYYHKLSLELYRKYKHGLRIRAWNAMKAFKQVIGEQREIKIEVLTSLKE